MKKKSYKITYILVAVFAVFLLMFSFVMSSGFGVAFADTYTNPKLAFEERNVMDDLKDSIIDGKPFNLKEYSLTTKNNLRVFSFVEYGYTYDEERQNDYGLYVYIYNPQGTKFVYNSVQNKIEFAFGENAQTYNKYSLRFLNMSTDPNYLGLFLKYKVLLSSEEKTAILDALNSTERVYVVSSVELLKENALNATDYSATGVKVDGSECSIVYRFSGYSKGYGVDSKEETLSFTQEEGDVLRLNVHHTSWREKGVTNGNDKYTQDSLNSVYFAIPKIFTNKYGYLSEVHCEWLNAITSWGLVTGNRDVYNAIYKYIGKNVMTPYTTTNGYSYASGNSDLGYQLFVNRFGGNGASSSGAYWSDLGYNPRSTHSEYCSELISQLNWLFSAGDGLDVADHTSISSDTLYNWYLKDFANIVGENYGETLELKDGVKIYKALFDYVDSEIKDYHIKAGEKQTLVGQKWTTDSWWIFHGNPRPDGDPVPTYADKIYQVTDNDFLSDKTMTCNNLFISTSDYNDFKDFYDKNKSENNIFLMRFAVTDFKSCEADEYNYSTNWLGIVDDKKLDSNAYFYKQNVFLDFDIIDVTFTNGEVSTVIPCVSNPIDIIPEATPPVFTKSDKNDWLDWVKIILAVLAIIILLVVLMPILPHIFSAIIWVLQLPFKALAKLFHRKE